MPEVLRRAMATLTLLAGLLLFVGGRAYLDQTEPGDSGLQFVPRMVLPVPGALGLAMGDAHLAANLGIIRSMVAATHIESPQERATFARLLENSLTLLPAQEDGYYLAQATLPWWGYVDRTQRLLDQATAARPWDWMPPFFRAFNLFYFRKAPEEAATHLRRAAARVPPQKRQTLLAVSARWTALGEDPREALRIIRDMAKSSRRGPLRRNLVKRAKQLLGLIQLRKAAEAYRNETGGPPKALEQLVGYGNLDSLPKDPTGDGFTISDEGKAIIKPPRALTQEPRLP